MASKKKKKKLPKYPNGGNFGSKIGDAFKIAGDTLLSTVGASDVIGDDAYRNQGFADASRVGEQIGAGAGQLAGSMFGMGSAVKLGQQAIGGLDGTDKERARIEQLRANPEAAGKYAQSIGQMNNAIAPLQGGIGAIGQIGAGAIQNGGLGSMFGKPQILNTPQSNVVKRPNGGSIPNINMPEQVQSGGERHLALQQQQKDLDSFTNWSSQMQPYTDAYGEPTSHDIDSFGQTFSDFANYGAGQGYKDKVQEGQQLYSYATHGKAAPQGAFNSPTEFGTWSDSNTGSDYSFYTGPTNPGAVPEHEVIATEDWENQIYPEQYTDDALAPMKGGGEGKVGEWDRFDTRAAEGFEVMPSGGGETFRPLPYQGEVGRLPEDLRPYSGQIGAYGQAQKSVDLPAFGYGGKIDSYDNGGKFVEYSGPTHAGGGIDVNAGGVPTNGQAAAEVEGGETMHDNGIESYIFSDRLVINPGDKKKVTYADASKKINNKYKNHETDKIANDTRKMELESLKQEQEIFKATMNGSDLGDSFATGGPIEERRKAQGRKWGTYTDDKGVIHFPNGGSLSQIRPKYEQDFTLGNLPYAPINTNNGLTGYGIVDDYNNMFPTNRATGPVNEFGTPSLLDETTPRILQTEEGTEKPQGTQLPQDKINPAGYFASNIGNLNDLIESAQPTEANQFGRMNPNTVNLDAQRKELEKQAGVSRAIARENARSSGGAGSAMTNQVIANALVNSNLGSGLSQSYMTEANTNAQIRNQAEQINTQIGMQEEIANQQDEAMGKSVRSKALHSIGANTDTHLKDITSAEVGNLNNKMWFDLVKEGKYSEYMPNEDGSFNRVIKLNGKYYDPKTKEELNSDGTKKSK